LGHGTKPWNNLLLYVNLFVWQFLQLGHGTKPWNNRGSAQEAARRELSSIGPRHEAVE